MNNTNLENSSVELKEVFLNAPLEFTFSIPKKIIKFFMNLATKSNYIWKYDKTKSFDKQHFSKMTKTILYYLYLNYICDVDTKTKLLNNIKNKEVLLDIEKHSKFPNETIFKNKGGHIWKK